MPGLVDCHLHSALYSASGKEAMSFFDFLSAFIRAEVAFRNTTVAREESMALVVSRLYRYIYVLLFLLVIAYIFPWYPIAPLQK